MTKPLQMWLARPVGQHSVNNNKFRWIAYAASDPMGAALTAVKWRKAQGGMEPRQVYEVVPMKLDQEGCVAQFKLGAVAKDRLHGDETVNALWDWDKRVEIRV